MPSAVLVCCPVALAVCLLVVAAAGLSRRFPSAPSPRNRRWLGVLLLAVLTHCGSNPGGLGIGFANQPTAARPSNVALHIARLYVPGLAAEPAYLELYNSADEPVALAATPLTLLSPYGQATLPSDGVWAGQSTYRLTGEALAGLALSPAGGELLLIGADLRAIAYAAWGPSDTRPRQRLGTAARQAALATPIAEPVPAALHPSQALFFLAEPGGAGWCTGAHEPLEQALAQSCVPAATDAAD